MYVVLEGIDTTGKSTQIELLKQIYPNAIFTSEPTQSDFGEIIRKLALYGEFCNNTQTMLFLADRAYHSTQILYPNLNELIISDRSLISGIAYSKLNKDLLINLNLQIAPKPNLAVILKTNKDILKNRLNSKENDNIEQNGIKYLLDIQDRIVDVAQSLGVDILLLDCDLDKSMITECIRQKIESLYR